MSTEAKARAFRPEDKELDDDLNASSDFLGIGAKFEGTFPNIEMNTVPHLQLVQHIHVCSTRQSCHREEWVESLLHAICTIIEIHNEQVLTQFP